MFDAYFLSSPFRLAMVNYYKVLKVSPGATQAEIKSAYRRLARKMHPDVKGNTEKATHEFAQVTKAYEILSNEQERAYFDRRLRKFYSSKSIHAADSVFYSDNPHASRLRRMAFERRYNEIIDRMMDSERREALALQQVVLPTVALFVSTLFVGIFKPVLWTKSQPLGKIILLSLFIIGVFHLFKRLRSGFQHFTYDPENLHDSILDETEPETKPYTRFKAAAFLIIGIGVSLAAGLLIGSYLELFITKMMPSFFSPTLQPEFIFYPPIVVLLVDLMHAFASRFEH